MKTLATQVTQIVQPYTLHPVTDDSTFEELRLTDVERDSIALDIENTLGIHVCDKTARGWQSVGDVVRAVAARESIRGEMA